MIELIVLKLKFEINKIIYIYDIKIRIESNNIIRQLCLKIVEINSLNKLKGNENKSRLKC